MGKWGEGGGTWVKARDMVVPNLTDKEMRAKVEAEKKIVGAPFDLRSVRPANVSGRKAFVLETADGRLFSVNQEGTTIGAQIARSGLPPAGRYSVEATPNAGSPSGYALSLKAL